MKFEELHFTTDKIHYMIHAIFENQDHDEDEVTIEYLDKNHYKVSLVDVEATELIGDPSYNCTVTIDIGRYSAVCKVIPEDKTCDESYFVFQYTQNIPMHFEIIYCQ